MKNIIRLRISWTSVKGRCQGNQLRQIGIPRLYCLCWHFTTDGNITTPIVVLTSTMILLRLLKFCELNPEILWLSHLHGLVGAHMAKMRMLLLFPRQCLRGIAKRSTYIEGKVGFIMKDCNCDGSLKGRCYGNRFVARVGENWHTPSLFCALALNNRSEYRNADYCVNIDDNFSTSDKNWWTLIQ